MKASLAPEIRKSVPKLAFAKFGFLDLADFVAVDRFLILSPTPALATPAIAS